MQVIKRNGNKEEVSFDKITKRIKGIAVSDSRLKPLDRVDYISVAQKVIDRLHDNITTSELDIEAAEIAAAMETNDIQYGELAKRILVSNLQRNTNDLFTDTINELYKEGSIADYMYYIANKYSGIIQEQIDYNRDFRCNYVGYRTMEKMYLLRNNNRKIIERIQNMWMRCAICIFREDIIGKWTTSTVGDRKLNELLYKFAEIKKIEEFHIDEERSNEEQEVRTRVVRTEISSIDFDKIHNELEKQYGSIVPDFTNVFKLYHAMSQGYCTHASPTLFQAGTRNESFISCYLKHPDGGYKNNVFQDSIDGMYQDIHEIANLFKSGGGVGYHLHDIRGAGSLVTSSNGVSDGLPPLLKVLNETTKHVRQGGRRNGSIAIYLEPWHCDIYEFLLMKKPQGEENSRARDLFYALWIPDAFMRSVINGDWWYLMSPDESPGLADVYGDEFEILYNKYIDEGRYRKKIYAQELWNLINEIRIETGTPYMLSKDACNKTSNQKNIGVIKSSNLCTEITLVSTPDETADCVLSSNALKKMVMKNEKGEYEFNYAKLGEITELEIKALNRVIDVNEYIDAKTKKSNMRHRPIALGIQGLQDVLFKLKIPYDSKAAREINRKIFETMCYHAVKSSMELAKVHGPYETFKGSPASKGQLQFNLWGKDIKEYGLMGFDWDSLINDVKLYGLRNSTLIALMPTASTSIIMNNVECFEPITSNIYKKKLLAGEFVILNKYLVKDLMKHNLWNNKIKQLIIAMNGSVQNIPEIPYYIKQLYKTVWELKQKVLVDMSIERGPYVCQSQSLNLYFDPPNEDVVSNATFYAWEQGLPTLCYYTRTQAATKAHSFTVDTNIQREAEKLISLANEPDYCMGCTG